MKALSFTECQVYCSRVDCDKTNRCRLKYQQSYAGMNCEYFKQGDKKHMELRLTELSSENFKGIKKFILEANGNNCAIYGNNGVGKTTLKDALTWLLFDKDSQNRSPNNFAIKPQDENGNDIHFLETTVEAVFMADGKEIKLKKMYSEKWVTKRGQETQEFSGHETLYWFDDVPCKKGEYQGKVDALVNEQWFKLLTDPLYFNTQLKWDERRRTLFELAGSNISDNDVIFANPDIEPLTAILNGKTPEEYKKMVAERAKRLNELLEKIPTRIDEVVKGMPEEKDLSEVEQELHSKQEYLNSIEAELMNTDTAVQAYIEKQKQLLQLKDKIFDKKQVLKDKANAVINTLNIDKNTLETNNDKLARDNKSLVLDNEKHGTEIENLEEENKPLRLQWQELMDAKFIEPTGLTCPTCGQDLPKEQTEQKISEQRAKFESENKQKLDSVNSKGKANKSRIEALQKLITDNQAKMSDNLNKITENEKRLEEISSQLVNSPAEPDYSKDTEIASLETQISDLQAGMEKPAEEDNVELKVRKKEVEQQIAELNKQLGNKDTIEQAKKRIVELKQEQKDTAQQIAELDKHKFLLEKFTKTKCNLLEDSINKMFKQVRFKLFDTQINGAVVECCDTLVNTNGSWVEYGSANNAGRINAGIEIINVISEHYGIYAPIMIDNSEGVQELKDIKSQIIELIVPLAFKKLPLEVKESLAVKFDGDMDKAEKAYTSQYNELRVVNE